MGAEHSRTLICDAPYCVDHNGLIDRNFASNQDARCARWPEEERLYFLYSGKLQCANLLGMAQEIQNTGKVRNYEFTRPELETVLEKAWNVSRSRLVLREISDPNPKPVRPFILQGLRILKRFDGISFPGLPSQTVYLMGELHNHVNNCPSGPIPVVKLSEYLVAQFKTSPKFFDLFIEMEPMQWNLYGNYSRNVSQMVQVRQKFMSCTTGKLPNDENDRCIYPNLRAHAVDMRESFTYRQNYMRGVTSAFTELLPAIEHFPEYWNPDEPDDGINHMLDLLQKVNRHLEPITNWSTFFQMILKEKPLLQKQLQALRQSNVMAYDALLAYANLNPNPYDYDDGRTEVDIPLLKLKLQNDELLLKQMVLSKSQASIVYPSEDFSAYMRDVLKVMFKTMDHAQIIGIPGMAPLMDVYTLARMLRRYTPRTTGPTLGHPEYVQNAIVVGGMAHIKWMTNFFNMYSGLRETLSLTSSYEDLSCIEMAGEPL
jgi:hypothetical protein